MKKEILNEIIENAKKLIGFKTIKGNYEEFNNAFDFVKHELNKYYIKEIFVDNYKNLVVSNTEEKDLDIIFCAHIDVVPMDKYEASICDNKMFGRGSFDMKSQLSVIMSLFKHNESKKKIAFIITSDEEIGGNCCREILKDYNSKLAVIPDAGKNFELVVEEKGLLQLKLIVVGKTAHASEPYKGDNPILKLFDIYNKLVEIYKLPTSEEEFITSINLSKIEGGNAVNMVPLDASMTLDIRYTKDCSKEEIINNIKKIDSSISIEVLDEGPVFKVDEKLPVIEEFLKNAEKILKRKVLIKRCVATSDAIYFSEKNIPTIVMNPIGDYWHGPNEYVLIDSLYSLYEIFKTLL